MKLAKLSLAAIMAAGAFSYANAGSLEEAIKGVEVSGFARYRFYDETANNSERHRFSGAVSFVTPVADSLKFKITLEAEDNEYAANGADAGKYGVNFSDFYFNYVTPEVNVIAGKQPINTPLTDPTYGGNRGTGVVALYTGVKGVTLAAGAFVNSNITASIGSSYVNKLGVAYSVEAGKIFGLDRNYVDGDNELAIGQENIYALAAIGSFGAVKAQLWGFKVTNVVDSAIFAEVSGNIAGFCAKAQYVYTDVSDMKDKGGFYGIKAGYKMDGFNVAAGYTKTDKDNGLTTLSADGSLIHAGKQIYYQFTNLPDTSTAFITAGAKFDKFGIGAGYVASKCDLLNADYKGSEYYLQASYAYSKKFGMNIYYSDMNLDEVNNVASGDNKEIRFEAKYSF